MPVMEIRIVWIGVAKRRMGVGMRMRLGARCPGRVGVLVMLVVPMQVIVREGLMSMFMLMVLAHVEPHAEPYARARDRQANRERVAEDDDRCQRAEKRRR